MAKQITRSQLAGLLRQEGFPEDLVPTFIAISQAESGLNPRAHNPRGADNSYGLLQVNMKGPMGEERRQQFGLKANEELFDPRTNVRAAKAIYDSQGLGAWSVTRSVKGARPAYEQFLPEAQKAAGVSSSMPQPTAPPPVDGKPTNKPTVKNNAEFLKSYIGGGLGATRALAPPAAPKSINVLGLLQSAFKAPKLME